MANSSARAVVDVGSVIADTYTIEGLIGKGGMGTVFLASHNRLPGKVVAIKLLHTDHEDEEILARFRREALIASQLNHPNIVAVHDFNVMADGTPYLILELLQGESLASRIDRDGALPIESVFAITRQVGSAIAAAHQHGIVHRDLKPQNIFLVPVEADGGVVEVAKVLDFGISKIRGSSTVKTQESSLLGTPQYMAPEQATGQHHNVDERTDLFALGAIVYEMLVGKPAFQGASIPEVVFKVVYEQPVPLAEAAPATPPHVVAAIAKAMQKQSTDRFATVGEFVEALTGVPLAARPTAGNFPEPDLGFATGSRIRPPGTGPGKSGVGRSGGTPITGSGKSPAQSGKSPAPATSPTSVQRTPSQSGKSASDAAIASTLDSGNHGNAATVLPSRPQSIRSAGVDATMAPVPPAAITMDSIGTNPTAAIDVVGPVDPPVEAPATAVEKRVVTPSSAPVVQVPERGKPMGLIVGLVIAGMIAAGVCVYLVMKRGTNPPGTAQPVALGSGSAPITNPPPTPDAAVAVAAVDAPPPADAAVAVLADAGVPADAPTTKPDAGVKPDKPDKPDGPGSAAVPAQLTEAEKEASKRIQDAEAALTKNTEAGNSEAQRLANAVIDSDAKRFHGRALAVNGVLKCRGNLPLEARDLLARIRDADARGRLLRGCKKAGYDKLN